MQATQLQAVRSLFTTKHEQHLLSGLWGNNNNNKMALQLESRRYNCHQLASNISQLRSRPVLSGERSLQQTLQEMSHFNFTADLAPARFGSQEEPISATGNFRAAQPLGEASVAAAMVAIRLALVILICVLLVKLASPTRSRRQRNLINSSSHIGSQTRPLYSRILSNLAPTTRQSDESVLRRRCSEPELSVAGVQQRVRRLSDTCPAHLKLPPGPMGLPFLGYLPFVGSEIHLTLTQLSQRYGPIYQIFLGGIRVVVLNDAALVRQAFKQPVFSGRPDTQITRILQGYGIVNSDGALWKEQRAFLHSALRKLGAKSLMGGSNGLEAKIQLQVKEFVKDLSAHASEGKSCQVRPIVARAVSSVVGSIVMNLTYRKYEEKEKFDRLIELMQEGFRLFAIAMPLDFIPIFRFLPGVSYAYKKMKKNRAETSAFFKGVADEHRKYLSETFNLGASTSTSSLHPASRNAGQSSCAPSRQLQQFQQQQHQQQQQHRRLQSGSVLPASVPSLLAAPSSLSVPSSAIWPVANHSDGVSIEPTSAGQPTAGKQADLDNIVARDLVDAYLLQQKRHETDGKENYFSDQQLVQIMSDIFSAGLETVTSTIEWSILFLMLNPESQKCIQEEIDRVIGRERLPQLDDLSQMAYTEATIYEVLRRSNVVALGNAHATLDDATLGGYRIPRGTQVLPNIYGIHMNPKLWNEPDKFDPSRFIVDQRAHKPDYFIPFSVGRRMCLGDVLAKMEVFLFLVGLLQSYDLTVCDEDRDSPPQIKGTIGVSNAPDTFKVALRHRKPATQKTLDTKVPSNEEQPLQTTSQMEN